MEQARVRHIQEVIDASGMIVMPGGVDIHTHIAGPKVNVGRILCPEYHLPVSVADRAVHADRTVHREMTSGVRGVLPSTSVTGYLYALMGYTTVVEAAVPPLKARHAHEELDDIPICDKLALILVGNNHFVLEYIRRKDYEHLADYVSWLLHMTRGYGIKVVNPGGIEAWKWGLDINGLDDRVPGFDVTPREVVRALLKVRDMLGLPHPVHLHTNNLGIPGNVDTTLATMKITEEDIGVDVPDLHVCHVQFSSYGKEYGFSSGAEAISSYVNAHPNISVDVGQVMFGDTLTMTADAPLEFRLARQMNSKWANGDVEMECGSGVLPIRFRAKDRASAVQWITGLELFLLIEDPWRVFLSTDHPNGASFTRYPEIIGLLMDAARRRDYISAINPKAMRGTVLSDLEREYTLGEIATVTRAAPARRLGLSSKGNLAPGSDADIAIYEPKADPVETFARARYVIKGGEVVVRDGAIVSVPRGTTFFVSPSGDRDPQQAFGRIRREVEDAFRRYYSVDLTNYGAGPGIPHRGEAIKCG
ncbi:MAG TPA: formylmethanofuran dehydrogenase subunit A [Clostridia bacterium]|nr:formylmethanofuran dehydrogenase subunit A [Clostridia bacterium]